MVCLGNICRSPLAEGILGAKLSSVKYFVDSAGTAGYHVGEQPDPRSIEVARDHGLDISGQRCRKFERGDFDRFDHIFVMDGNNYSDVLALARNEEDTKKVRRILDVLHPDEGRNVPDPYYGGAQGFVKVYRMLDDACEALVIQLEGG